MDLPTRPAVVLTREPEDNAALALALKNRGAAVVEIPCIKTSYVTPEHVPGMNFDVFVFSSRRAVRGMKQARLLHMMKDSMIAAVGKATADQLAAHGIRADIVAHPPEGRVLAPMIIEKAGPEAAVAVVRGNIRAGGLDSILLEAGYRIVPLIVYENIAPVIAEYGKFPVAAVFVASPSAARRLYRHNGWMIKHPVFVIGSTTKEAVEKLGAESVTVMGAGFDSWVELLYDAYVRASALEES